MKTVRRRDKSVLRVNFYRKLRHEVNNKNDKRFGGINPLEEKAFLSLATLHQDDEKKFIDKVYAENFLTTEGCNVNGMEETVAEYMSVPGLFFASPF